MILTEYSKSKSQKIRISVESFHDHNYLDIRMYFEAEDGTWRPTKRGVKINMNMFEDLMKTLVLADKELKKQREV